MVIALCILVLAIALFTGLSGPVYERRNGGPFARLPFPFSLPDGIFTLPLCAAVYRLVRDGARLHDEYALSWWMGVSSLAGVLILAVQSKVLMRWIRRLPAHLQIPADAAVYGSIWRGLLRCCAWQGLLLILPTTQEVALQMPWLLILPSATLVFSASWMLAHGPDFLATLRWFRDPFSRLQRSGTQSDWFISYRSSQSNEVRAIVDGLTARGHIVWFAEYMIRFLVRDQFQPAIDRGIAASRKGMLCTSKTYSSSRYCMNEFRQLVQRCKEGACTLVEVQFEGPSDLRCSHKKDLASVPLIKFSGSTDGVLQLLPVTSASESRHPNSSTSMPDEDHDLKVEGYGVRLQFSDAHWKRIGVSDNPLDEERRFVAWFRNTMSRRQCELRITITFHSDPVEQALHAATMPIPDLACVGSLQFARQLGRAGEEDLALCSAMRDFEMVRTAATGEYCLGVHLLHHHGHGHSLLTVWARRCWMRRCYLLFDCTNTKHRLQVRMDFLFHGPFREFLVQAAEFDRTMESMVLIEETSPSPDVLPPDKVSQGQDIPIADVLARMNSEAASCPYELLPRFLTNQAFFLVECANESPRQQTQLYQHALERLDKALAIRSDHGHTYQEKAYIYSRLHNYEQALAASREAMRSDPENPKFRATSLGIQLNAMIASPDNIPWCQTFDELDRETDWLLRASSSYPSACFLKANLLAITKPRQQSEWEQHLAAAAQRYRSLYVMPSGKRANAKDVVSTMIENTLLCCALAQRFGTRS